jgi:GGDEF domain-containing protein
MTERRTLHVLEEADLERVPAIRNLHLHRRLAAPGVVALVTCVLLLGASAAAAAPPNQPYPDELWREFPLDPRQQEQKASTDATPARSSAPDENATQTPSQSERGSDSGSLPLPVPLLLFLSVGAAVLLWLFAVGSIGNFRRSRLSELRSILPRLQAALGGGDAVPSETSIVPRVEAALGGGHAVREETTDDVSAVAAPAADPSGSDKLLWLKAEIERARRGHDVLSLLLVRFDQPTSRAGAGPGEDVAQAVASAIEEALHDVPRELRRDGELISVVLPHTMAEGAKRLAARVQLFVPEAMPETRTHVSFYTAVACFPRDASTAEELLQICEQELAFGRGSAGG